MKLSRNCIDFSAITLFLILISAVLPSCALLMPAPSQMELKKAYANAVSDAEFAEPEEISKNLTAIVAYNKNLQWKGPAGKSHVLVATWTDYRGYLEIEGQDYTTPEGMDIWVTAVPELRNFCQAQHLSSERLILRLKQLLGLPPGSRKIWFVELWVDPADLFRPSPDPEITDHEAELEFPVSSKFVTVSDEHVQWFNGMKKKSYKYSNDGYPWTRLGYTYDWGNSESEIGLSEFVIKGGANVIIEKAYIVEEYCSRPE
ncbi:MAG: hypothetical protein JSW26_00990 [Desulfobacterales bacterium]|nr:MAG: hypothetical protein JSW26_00990 [Desulfobacterales bacterium]